MSNSDTLDSVGTHHPSSAPIHIVGPTAVGKSEVAVAVARRLDGEIISVDSMQVYRGLDIGAAKPSLTERQGIPHHLVDICELTETFNAAHFLTRAQTAEADIIRRGKRPIYCGGTGLYLSALHGGLGEAPPSDPTLRAELENADPERLRQELKARDPLYWDRVDRSNMRRVIRAVEAIRLANRPYSELRADWRARAPSRASLIMGLRRDRAELTDRIDRRVDRMISAGLVAETARLMRAGLESNTVAMQAIGYRQVVAHLKLRTPLNEVVEQIKVKTRQYAKRQMNWFNRKLKADWIDLTGRPTQAAVDEILSRADRF